MQAVEGTAERMVRRSHKAPIAWLLLLATGYATLGPPLCRAAMAGQTMETAENCCAEPAQGRADGGAAPRGGEPHQSCPLHRISLIQLLPTSSRHSAIEDAGEVGRAAALDPEIAVEHLLGAGLDSTRLAGFKPYRLGVPLYLLQCVHRL
jgi:hypothetical protein